MNGKGNVFQRGTIHWFAFYVGSFHGVTERIRGKRCIQAGRGGRSQGRKAEDEFNAIKIS